MDGKVEISILQWEKMREELKAKNEKLAELEDTKKEIKLTIVEKNHGGHYKWNRWTNMNEYVPESHEVEHVKYSNLEGVKSVLLEEAKAEVQETLTKNELEVNELNGRMRTLKKNHDDVLRKIEEKTEEKIKAINTRFDKSKIKNSETIKTIKEEHAQEIEVLTEEFEAKIQELQDIIDDKKRTTEEEEREQERKELNERVNNLLKLSQDMYDRLPWYKKRNLTRPE